MKKWQIIWLQQCIIRWRIDSSDRKETINYIISECNELAQKEYKSRHGWVGKIIQKELCKKLKFIILTISICTNQSLT